MSKFNKAWSKIRYQYLDRHASEIYYARLTVNGRKAFRSLKTKILEVAIECGLLHVQSNSKNKKNKSEAERS